MKYKVTMTWMVEIPEGKLEELQKGYRTGKIDPKKLAAIMAMDKAVASLVERGDPDAVIDVEEVVN